MKSITKIKILRIILIILLLATFELIFHFSSQNGEESSEVSRGVTNFFTRGNKKIQSESQADKNITLWKIEKVIRKLAHFSIYTLVGILLMCIMITYKTNGMASIKGILLSLVIGALYATSDEIHQIFTPGRTALVTDAFIDSAGVLLGIMIVYGIYKLIGCIRNKTKLKKQKIKT